MRQATRLTARLAWQVEYLKHEMLASIPSLATTYETLQDWKWRFGVLSCFFFFFFALTHSHTTLCFS
jgi:hypothetical protein